MAATRDNTFDALKLFAILMVLWGHAIQHFGTGERYLNPVFLFIYSFHMPLFMAITGYFSGSAARLTIKDLIVKKGRQLIVPALVVGTVFILIGIVDTDLRGGLRNYITELWFLKSAFGCFLLYCIGCKLSKRLTGSITAGVVLTLLLSVFIHFYHIRFMYPCFIFGVLINACYGRLRAKSGIIALVSGILFAAMLLVWDSTFQDLPGFSTVKYLPDNPGPLLTHLYRFSFRIGIGLAGSLFFITLFIFLSGKLQAGAVGQRLCSWGRETLGIYLFQTVVLEILLPRWLHLGAMHPAVFNFVVTPLIALISLLVCLAIITLVEHSALLSQLLLGKTPKKF